MKTEIEYNQEIDILQKEISYEDDSIKKQKLQKKLLRKRLEKEIAQIRKRIEQLG